jgi:hypothetical protein
MTQLDLNFAALPPNPYRFPSQCHALYEYRKGARGFETLVKKAWP